MTDLVNSIDMSLSFNNETIRVLGTSEEPLFVVKDICKILGLSNPTATLRNIPEKWRSLLQVRTSNNCIQNTNVVNESGLYKIIMRSEKPIAEPFQNFVCEKILPSIRKTGEYKFQKILDEKNKLIKELENKQEELLVEQKTNIKLKQKLIMHVPKNNFRHKFQVEPCVYVLEDPDNKYAKYKIGKSDNINERLADDRTMIPQIKVRLILYTHHNSLFEQNIKIKYQDRLELPSHEWVFEDLEKLIENIKKIDMICGYNSIEEKELWKYNLENPDEKKENQISREEVDIWKEDIKQKVLKNENRYDSMLLSDRLHLILPSYLSNSDHNKKNEDAPEGKKWCNAWCQKYKPKSDFGKIAKGLVKICMTCHSMEVLAYQKIKNGELTPDQIRKNPTLIALYNNQKVCVICGKIKNVSEFDSNRKKCQQCRSEGNKEVYENFRKNIKEEIKKLIDMSKDEREFKIKKILKKDQLVLIIGKLKLGRKSSERKNHMVDRILKYFEYEKVILLEEDTDSSAEEENN